MNTGHLQNFLLSLALSTKAFQSSATTETILPHTGKYWNEGKHWYQMGQRDGSTQWFSDVLRGYRKRPVAWNGLMIGHGFLVTLIRTGLYYHAICLLLPLILIHCNDSQDLTDQEIQCEINYQLQLMGKKYEESWIWDWKTSGPRRKYFKMASM